VRPDCPSEPVMLAVIDRATRRPGRLRTIWPLLGILFLTLCPINVGLLVGGERRWDTWLPASSQGCRRREDQR
jgi:hypothetical protein